MPGPNKPHDELDALLDGRPVELTEELVPLVEVADVLRAELATYELDPKVADRHLERVLEGSATVVRMPLRQQPNGWDLRRRVAAVVLAAALVLAPATFASAASLPGQPMYPFKLAIEQLRLASVQWSVTREAGERTRVADERVGELKSLVRLKMFNQVGPAVDAVTRAVRAARAAVDEASEEAGPSELSKLAGQLKSVQGEALVAVDSVVSTLDNVALRSLSHDTRAAIEEAVADSHQVLESPPVLPTETPTTLPGPSGGATPPNTSPVPQSTLATTPPSTDPPTPTTVTTTTEPTTTTTTVPTTTGPPPTSGPEVPAAPQSATEGAGYSPEQQILDQAEDQVPPLPVP